MRPVLLLGLTLVSNGCWEPFCFYRSEPLCPDPTRSNLDQGASCRYAETAFLTGAAATKLGLAVGLSGTSVLANDAQNRLRVYAAGSGTLTLSFEMTDKAELGLATSGNSLFISKLGSPSKDVVCRDLSQSGASCAGSPAAWPEPAVAAMGDTTSDYYGRSLAAAGNRLLISDPDDGSVNQGQVYLHDLASATPRRLRDGTFPGGFWGGAIALSSAWAVIARSGNIRKATVPTFADWSDVALDAGCAFAPVTLATRPEQSLALSGDVLMAAATCGGKSDVRDYSLNRGIDLKSTWDPALKSEIEGATRLALSQADNVAVIGAPSLTTGSAWSVERDGASGAARTQTKLVPRLSGSPAPSAAYGQSVATAGGRIVVGDPAANGNSGAIHLFECMP